MKLYAVAAVVDSVMATLRGTENVRKVTKTALMPALAATTPPRDPGMAVGLAGSWAGDVALLGDSDRAFRTGLFSFLVAHLGYTAALARRSRPGSRKAVLPIVAASAAGAAAFARAAGPMGRPVGLYALTLGTMVAAASTARGRGARRVFGGAALFAVSDALLGASRFVLKGRAARVASAGGDAYVRGRAVADPHGVRTGGGPRLKTRWQPCANVLPVGKSKAPAPQTSAASSVG